MLKKKLLFWPGRGKQLNILIDFIAMIKKSHDVCIFPFEYDTGEIPFYHNAQWCKWLLNNRFDWWCGISLGASLSYVMSSLCIGAIPERLTMINPFNSRGILAKEKNFSLENQWDFSLSDYMVEVNNIDMVLSVYDEKIPIYHGVSILNKTTANSKVLYFVNDNHRIENQEAQIELARLLTEEDRYDRTQDSYSHYCYVYKQ